MAMFLSIKKVEESPEFVWYTVKEDVKIGIAPPDKKGREWGIFETKIGTFKINKRLDFDNAPIDDLISLIEEKSDPYFRENYRTIIRSFIQIMNDYKMEKKFPDFTAIAIS